MIAFLDFHCTSENYKNLIMKNIFNVEEITIVMVSVRKIWSIRDSLFRSQILILMVALSVSLIVILRSGILNPPRNTGSVDVGIGYAAIVIVVIPFIIYSILGIIIALFLIPYLRKRYKFGNNRESLVKKSRISRILAFTYSLPVLILCLMVIVINLEGLNNSSEDFILIDFIVSFLFFVILSFLLLSSFLKN